MHHYPPQIQHKHVFHQFKSKLELSNFSGLYSRFIVFWRVLRLMRICPQVGSCRLSFAIFQMYSRKSYPVYHPSKRLSSPIDLIPCTTPISIPPYRFAPAELRELKVQLEELLEVGFILPSTSPWGAPVLSAPNHYNSLHLCFDYRKLNRIEQNL